MRSGRIWSGRISNVRTSNVRTGHGSRSRFAGLRPRWTWLLVPLLALVGSCALTPGEPDPDWISAEVQAPSQSILWDMTIGALDRLGYPVGSGLDPSELHALSGWKLLLGTFSGDGRRLQAEVRYRPLADATWMVDVRIKQQRNVSLIDPTEVATAEWEWTADDREAAQVLLQHIRSALDPRIELSPAAAPLRRPR
jgi:hypothetical protein